MTKLSDLAHATLPLVGTEKIPAVQAGQTEDVYVTPLDIANMPVLSRVDATTTIVPTLTDAFKVIETTATTSVSFTIPPHAAVGFDVGVVLQTQQIGTGRITHAAGVGVTVRWPKAVDGTTDCKISRAIHSPASFRQRALNDWVVEGDLSST